MPTRKPAVAPFLVVRDTRDHADKSWTFRKSEKCAGTVVRTLKTGDFTLVGLESILTVERKGSLGEFVGNLGKADLPRFERELTRMAEFKRAFVVLEFTLDDLVRWPASSGLGYATRRRIRTTGAYVLKVFLQVQARHPHVHFIFAGKHGQTIALALFKQAWADYGHLVDHTSEEIEVVELEAERSLV